MDIVQRFTSGEFIQRDWSIEIVEDTKRRIRREQQLGSGHAIGAIRRHHTNIGIRQCRCGSLFDRGPIAIEFDLYAWKAPQIPVAGIVINVTLEEYDPMAAAMQGAEEAA